MKTMSPQVLIDLEQQARWHRTLVLDWCEAEGIRGSDVALAVANDDGTVTLTMLDRGPDGHVRFKPDRSAPVQHDLTITPRNAPPWLEWE